MNSETLSVPPSKQNMRHSRTDTKSNLRRELVEISKEECPEEHLKVKKISDCCGCCSSSLKACAPFLLHLYLLSLLFPGLCSNARILCCSAKLRHSYGFKISGHLSIIRVSYIETFFCNKKCYPIN